MFNPTTIASNEFGMCLAIVPTNLMFFIKIFVPCLHVLILSVNVVFPYNSTF